MEYKSPLVCIIVLNWNGCEVSEPCLQSISQIDYDNYNVVLVDNGSIDGSGEKLKEKFNCNDKIHFLLLDKNYGFTGGNNIGIKYAVQKWNPSFVLLLNNDTIVNSNFLSIMVNAFADKSCYAIVPKILCLDQPEKVLFAGGSVSKWTGNVKNYGYGKKDSEIFNIQQYTSFMNGCCALLSAECIQNIGLLDDRFFASSEDADYSLRILKSGHKIKYAPQSVIYHKVHYSFKANKGKWLTFYLGTRGIILLQKKHLPRKYLPIFISLFFIRWTLYLTFKLLMMKDLKSIKGLYVGFFDGITNKIRYVI